MYNKIMEREKGSRKYKPEGNDLMKKLTSKIIGMIYNISCIVTIPLAVIKICEIISGRAAIDPRISSLMDGLFWSALAVQYLCHWYINKHKNEIEA